MAIEREDLDERQARLDRMIAEFRTAQQRRLVKQGRVLWNRTGLVQPLAKADPPDEKIN